MRKKLFDDPVKTVVLTWLLAGTLDALAAMIVYQIKPLPLFRYIASGALGPDAMSAGIGMALVGLLFHYFIAFFWTILFFIIYPKVALLSWNRFVTGLLYGIVVWGVMNLVVVPLTTINRAPFTFQSAAIGAVILMFAIGLPISFFIGRYYARQHAGRTP